MQAPAHGLIDVADGRLVVADHEQLELRHELEEVLAHEAGGDLVATGQGLELAFGPAAALLGLDRGDDPGATEARHVGRMPIAVGCHEHVHGSDGGIVAHDGCEGVGEDRFAVGARAIKKEQRVFGCDAGEAIARHAPQIVLELPVAPRDGGKEAPSTSGTRPAASRW